jgi:hypothetical protein
MASECLLVRIRSFSKEGIKELRLDCSTEFNLGEIEVKPLQQMVEDSGRRRRDRAIVSIRNVYAL